MPSIRPALIALLILIAQFIQAQKTLDTAGYKIVAAGSEYKKSSFYQWLWGTNYRKEWTTPVKFRVAFLDTLKGGIKEFKPGGSHQTKSLHIKTMDDKAYTLRSVDKSLDKLLPKIFKHTFIENVVNDEIATSDPYGALGIPVMAKAAGINHMNPKYYWIPKQPALDSLNKKYGSILYLFEQRPSGDWSEADNMGNFKKFISSDELLDKMYADNNIQVDQVSFVKERLFDMLIGDFDRHWDQYKWGRTEKGDHKLYVPVPTDRDQVFFKANGVLLKAVIAAAGLKFAQSFNYEIKDIAGFNSAQNLLDRFFTNEVSLKQWQEQAGNLQQALTDEVIETSIKQMPPEIFAISGNEIIAKLKSRRTHLVEYATKYYKFLAEEVDIVGSKKNEYFEVDRINDNETSVRIFNIDKSGRREDSSFYSRKFQSGQTKEIRLFGLSGNDIFTINGKVGKGIKIRIIGGNQRDSIIDNSNVKTRVYDDNNNTFIKGSKTKLHLSDSTDHEYSFNTYIPDKSGRKPMLFYDYNDRFYVGVGYEYIHHAWRKLPFASKQDIALHYSLSQKAISVIYQGLFPKLVGKNDLLVDATYDAIRWANFYGIGNNTTLTTTDVKYNRVRSQEVLGSIGLQRKFGNNTIDLSGFFERVKVINDKDEFISKIFAPTDPTVFNVNNYAGAQLKYKAVFINDSIVPTKGIAFFGNATYSQNIENNQSYERYTGILQFYIPLISKFSLAIRNAGTTVTGNPMFYQLPHIGGPDDLLGYKRERFWGNTAFTNINELRFITDLRTHLMNGKIGLMVFYDDGRVWIPNEISNVWHTDYGAGLLLAPFNKFLANIAYGISKENSLIQLRLIKSI